MEFEIARLGERGQIVIPHEFREHMGLHKGDKFIVIERADTLLLKRLKSPTLEDFKAMIKKGHAHARKYKLKEKHMHEAIKKARSKK